ncbi:hypothetical protein DPMN_119423 [Dreissena polymorpha]|nr:hypothetical protein DPMN_119423 [Dreissena polymorpha]
MEREVTVGSSLTRVKDITISDNRWRVKLTLWREACDMPHRPGTFIQVTNAVTNVHRGETLLSLTSRSFIQVYKIAIMSFPPDSWQCLLPLIKLFASFR